MRDARAVGDDQRRARIGLGLAQRLHRLVDLGAEGHLGDVDVAVAHRLEAEVLLGDLLAGDGELGGGAQRRRLGLLAAGVRVDLGVEHQDVDVAAQRQHVVEAAVADVVGPAVAADQPDALGDQVVGHQRQPGGGGVVDLRQQALELLDALPLRGDLGMPSAEPLSRSSTRPSPSRPASDRSRPRACSVSPSTASRKPSPNSALSSNSELDQAGPRPLQSCVQGVVGRLPP